jgi:DNA anti-recombination protein RmuC
VEVEVEAAAEDMIPASETPEEIAKKEAAVSEVMKKLVMALEEISTEMGKMKAKMSEMESNYEKFSKTPGAVKAPKVTRGEFASENDSLDSRIATMANLKNDGFFKKA